MYVYACVSGFDPASGQCDGNAAWVEAPDTGTSLTALLPTVEQANAVGIAMFTSLIIVVAFRGIIVSTSHED